MKMKVKFKDLEFKTTYDYTVDNQRYTGIQAMLSFTGEGIQVSYGEYKLSIVKDNMITHGGKKGLYEIGIFKGYSSEYSVSIPGVTLDNKCFVGCLTEDEVEDTIEKVVHCIANGEFCILWPSAHIRRGLSQPSDCLVSSGQL